MVRFSLFATGLTREQGRGGSTLEVSQVNIPITMLLINIFPAILLVPCTILCKM